LLLPVLNDIVTNVVGIWSVFFKSSPIIILFIKNLWLWE